MTYGNPVNIKNLPDTPGKRVLLQILNSPRADMERLRQESLAYKKEELLRYRSRNETRPSPRLVNAMLEALQISGDLSVKADSNTKDLFMDLNL